MAALPCLHSLDSMHSILPQVGSIMILLLTTNAAHCIVYALLQRYMAPSFDASCTYDKGMCCTVVGTLLPLDVRAYYQYALSILQHKYTVHVAEDGLGVNLVFIAPCLLYLVPHSVLVFLIGQLLTMQARDQ